MEPVKREIGLRHTVHRVLLGGLVVSGLLLGVGLMLALVRGAERPEGPPPRLGELLVGAVRGDAVNLVDLGLLVLMATPVLRVVVLAQGWFLEREPVLLAIALAVLGLLGVSFLLGLG